MNNTPKKRKIVLIITDETDIESLREKITREYAKHIWGHYVDIPISEGLSTLPYREDYSDGDEG